MILLYVDSWSLFSHSWVLLLFGLLLAWLSAAVPKDWWLDSARGRGRGQRRRPEHSACRFNKPEVTCDVMKKDRAEVATGLPISARGPVGPVLIQDFELRPFPNEFALTLLVFIDNWFVIVDSAQRPAELSTDPAIDIHHRPLESNWLGWARVSSALAIFCMLHKNGTKYGWLWAEASRNQMSGFKWMVAHCMQEIAGSFPFRQLS